MKNPLTSAWQFMRWWQAKEPHNKTEITSVFVSTGLAVIAAIVYLCGAHGVSAMVAVVALFALTPYSFAHMCDEICGPPPIKDSQPSI